MTDRQTRGMKERQTGNWQQADTKVGKTATDKTGRKDGNRKVGADHRLTDRPIDRQTV
jgi:hypothetical protein